MILNDLLCIDLQLLQKHNKVTLVKQNTIIKPVFKNQINEKLYSRQTKLMNELQLYQNYEQKVQFITQLCNIKHDINFQLKIVRQLLKDQHIYLDNQENNMYVSEIFIYIEDYQSKLYQNYCSTIHKQNLQNINQSFQKIENYVRDYSKFQLQHQQYNEYFKNILCLSQQIQDIKNINGQLQFLLQVYLKTQQIINQDISQYSLEQLNNLNSICNEFQSKYQILRSIEVINRSLTLLNDFQQTVQHQTSLNIVNNISTSLITQTVIDYKQISFLDQNKLNISKISQDIHQKVFNYLNQITIDQQLGEVSNYIKFLLQYQENSTCQKLIFQFQQSLFQNVISIKISDLTKLYTIIEAQYPDLLTKTQQKLLILHFEDHLLDIFTSNIQLNEFDDIYEDFIPLKQDFQLQNQPYVIVDQQPSKTKVFIVNNKSFHLTISCMKIFNFLIEKEEILQKFSNVLNVKFLFSQIFRIEIVQIYIEKCERVFNQEANSKKIGVYVENLQFLLEMQKVYAQLYNIDIKQVDKLETIVQKTIEVVSGILVQNYKITANEQFKVGFDLVQQNPLIFQQNFIQNISDTEKSLIINPIFEFIQVSFIVLNHFKREHTLIQKVKQHIYEIFLQSFSFLIDKFINKQNQVVNQLNNEISRMNKIGVCELILKSIKESTFIKNPFKNNDQEEIFNKFIKKYL